MAFSRTDSVVSSVLIIESDPLMLTAMGSILNRQGHRAVLARTEEVAMESIESGQFDVIILSIEERDAGCGFADRLRSDEKTREVPVIFLVPEESGTWGEALAEHGGVYSLVKPIDPYELIELVEKTLWMPHIAKGKIDAPSMLGGKLLGGKQNDWTTLGD